MNKFNSVTLPEASLTLAVPEIFCSHSLTKFRPLCLYSLRFICHWQLSVVKLPIPPYSHYLTSTFIIISHQRNFVNSFLKFYSIKILNNTTQRQAVNHTLCGIVIVTLNSSYQYIPLFHVQRIYIFYEIPLLKFSLHRFQK